ncbi:uncharacterized protein BX663DRAFT_501713 [Cokeromyces recurvatus]|uniref:uncharacterized protein n=1 Tax=Cokeromyces recurvatus TaxID=90255 RepID=UPI00221EC124|nr:uncharacterized protein BX663DRAFT_501713 [Cokeromyces recurvatus]KAI7905096.1 hypothetical protein BX663DRAFT_501713 [Cokeromyces recurvatus]
MSGVPKCLDPFLLTIDHKNPLFKGGNSGIENLQITLYCLNQVKGTESNHEMLRWFNIIRSITRP